MDTPRKRVLRAATLILLICALATPAHGATWSPIWYWTPDGPATYGDPDLGGGGIEVSRRIHEVLVEFMRRIGLQASVRTAPTNRSSPAPTSPTRIWPGRP